MHQCACRAGCGWAVLRRAPLPVPNRARRLCSSSAIAAAAAGGAAPWDAPTAVEPPPTVPFSPDAVNSVAVSGTVLKDPQVYHLAAQQVKAQLRLGLSHLHTPAGAINVDAWGVLALQAAQHVRAGSRIQVRGSLRQDSWLDKNTGERQWMVKIVADKLALLAHHDGEGGQHAEAAAAADAAAHAALQHEQPMPPQPMPPQPDPPMPLAAQHYQAAAPYQPALQQPSPPAAASPGQGRPAQAAQEAQRPRVTFSAEQSRQMYEVEGLSLDVIAAQRGIKTSTVVEHLLATTAGGGFNSWGRLAAEVGLGPECGPLLAPAEVAQAIADVEQQHPGTELGRLPLRAIRERLETTPATAPKVAALVGQRSGDPVLLYGCIKLVLAALHEGVSFGVLTSRGGQSPF